MKRDLLHSWPRRLINSNFKRRDKVVVYGQIGIATNSTPTALNLDDHVFLYRRKATADRDILLYYEFNIMAAFSDGGV